MSKLLWSLIPCSISLVPSLYPSLYPSLHLSFYPSISCSIAYPFLPLSLPPFFPLSLSIPLCPFYLSLSCHSTPYIPLSVYSLFSPPKFPSISSSVPPLSHPIFFPLSFHLSLPLILYFFLYFSLSPSLELSLYSIPNLIPPSVLHYNPLLSRLLSFPLLCFLPFVSLYPSSILHICGFKSQFYCLRLTGDRIGSQTSNLKFRLTTDQGPSWDW